MKLPLGFKFSECLLLLSLGLLAEFAEAQTSSVPQSVVINSGRPTFYEPQDLVPGKIALEEHVSNELFNGLFTTPFVNFTNEPTFTASVYGRDVAYRLTNIDARVAAMDAANISMNIVMFVPPGIQGIFNKTFAAYAATYVNNEIARVYNNGNFSSRFGFWCNNALQDPVSAATELERCVKELGGVGSFVAGYTNNLTANDVIYLDHPINAPFLEKVVELDVPIYLHPRDPPPNQQRIYQDYWILASSPWGYSSETAAHALRLMLSGIFDRYPTLKVILGHCGEGLPFYLPRIDARLRHAAHTYPAKQTMTYYWENNFFATTSGVSDFRTALDTLLSTGEDSLMFSADYPFEDDTEMGSWFDRLQLNSKTKDKIAFLNARKILKLDLVKGMNRR